MASYSSNLVKLAVAAMAMTFVGSCMGAPDISLKLWKMQLAINSTKGYSAFQPAFYSSSVFNIYTLLSRGQKVTLLVPSDKALAAIPESIKSNATLFQKAVLLNAFYGKVTIHDIKSAHVGKLWTSLYQGSKVKKVAATKHYNYGLQISPSTTPTEIATVFKGNLFRDRALYCHGVDFYFLPTDM